MSKWILPALGLLTSNFAYSVVLGEDLIEPEYRVAIRSSHMAEFPLCSGSLIREQWILTAAHCVVFSNGDTLDESTYYVARPGELSITYNVDNLDDVEENISNFVNVSHVVVHPDYHRLHVTLDSPELSENVNTELTHDVALLRLEKPLKISTVNLATPSIMLDLEQKLISDWKGMEESRPENLHIAGWGSTNKSDPNNNTVSVQLQQTSQAFYPIDECYSRLEEGKPLPEFIESPIDATKLCTLPTKLELLEGNGTVIGNSACIGDSGGAIVAQDAQGDEFQVGIVSGAPLIMPICGSVSEPSFHSKVAYFYDWIVDVVDVTKVPNSTIMVPTFITKAQQELNNPPEDTGDTTCSEEQSIFKDCDDSSSGGLGYIPLMLLGGLLGRRKFLSRD